MQFAFTVRNIVLTSVLVIGASHLALAQSAEEIVKKANALYTGAKTFQATMVMDMSMGPMGSMSATTELKSIGNKKMSAKTHSNVTATGQPAIGAASLNMQIVDDGKSMYMYMPSMNKYSKRPHVANGQTAVGSMLPLTLNSSAMGKATYKMLPATTVAGKPCYAIAINGFPGAQTASIVLYIEKSTYHFRQMKMKMAQGKTTPTTPPGQSTNMTMTMTFQNEKFNAPIPDSEFKFTPPPGATQMQGFPGMMGGAPGGTIGSGNPLGGGK